MTLTRLMMVLAASATSGVAFAQAPPADAPSSPPSPYQAPAPTVEPQPSGPGPSSAPLAEPPSAPAPVTAPSASPPAPQAQQPPAAQPEPSATPASPQSAQPSGEPSGATLAAINDATLADMGEKGGVSPAILRAEVMLDRLHDSPGVIDGRNGENFEHALEIFEQAHDLKPAKTLDKESWDLLVKESGSPVLGIHTLTADEVKGPFFPDIPRNYAKQAEMKTLGYRSVAQKLGAEFHMSETLLAELNPGADLSKPGTRILATLVTPEPLHHTLHEIIVNKGKSQVVGLDAQGRVIVAYPATIGSRELPSPSGTYKVKGVAWHPIYYYNPKNFIQGHNHEKLELPPGPNNPVGKVFIALTKPTYGLHGTPDPAMIDKTASHGCVRMTNWDALQLAHLVHPGLVVSFRRHFRE